MWVWTKLAPNNPVAMNERRRDAEHISRQGGSFIHTHDADGST